MILCGYIKVIQYMYYVIHDCPSYTQDLPYFVSPQGSRYRSFYYLPVDNDIEKRGRVYKVRLERVGRIVNTNKYSYKRVLWTWLNVYLSANTRKSVAKDRWRVLQKYGDKKFGEGTGKEPKYSLLLWYHDYLTPSFQVLVDIIVEDSSGRVIVKYQIDRAGSH